MKKMDRSLSVSGLAMIILIILLCCEYSLVTCTDGMTPLFSTKERSALQVMVVIPTAAYTSNTITRISQWEKGEETLPGAHLAAKEINETSNLLGGHQLEVIPVRVPHCELLSEAIVPFVKELTSNRNIIGIVGYFCHTLAQYLSPLAHYWTAPVIQILATSLEDSSNDDNVPYLQHSILPLRESIASATVQLLQSLGWNKIAIIGNQNPTFIDSRRAFVKNANENGIQIETHLEAFHSPNEYLLQLQRYGIKIVVAFVPQSEAVDILCTAYHNGFQWPDYAWIFTDISKPKIFNEYYCPIEAINNAIFLHLTQTQINPKLLLPSGLNYGAYYKTYIEELEKSSVELNVSLQSNPYANVLYDSIWAVALTINRSLSVLNERNLSLTNIHQDTGTEIMNLLEEQLSQLSFQGATGWLNFSHSAAAAQTSVEILQLQNGQPIQIGLFFDTLNLLSLNISVLGVIPSVTLDRIYLVYPAVLTMLLSTFVILCFILTTVSMCLFIYYRNEPAIKATSNTLSLCLFIGCYFLLASSLFHIVIKGIPIIGNQEIFRTFICKFDVITANIGADIVCATVIAKTLRIYHIFKTFGKVGRSCSDQILVIMILGIISGKIAILIVWANVDDARVVDVEQFVSQRVPPFFQVTQECQSEHINIWHASLVSYSAILGLVMVLLAILTRKIKRKDYKDSKKLTYLLLL